MSNNHKGYALFLDIEDKKQRIINQATVLANIFEDNLAQTGALKGKGCSSKGAELTTGYFENLNHGDRRDVLTLYRAFMVERGFMEVLH